MVTVVCEGKEGTVNSDLGTPGVSWMSQGNQDQDTHLELMSVDMIW
jgi:hypothetical protein